MKSSDPTDLYKCLCNRKRLRILNLLSNGPLCVCHLSEVLGEEQPQVSKELRLMRTLGMLACAKVAQWSVYRIGNPADSLLRKNLECLRSNQAADYLHTDLEARDALLKRLRAEGSRCTAALDHALTETNSTAAELLPAEIGSCDC